MIIKDGATSSIQERVRELYECNSWNTDPTLLLIAMQEELGELAGRWLVEHPGYDKSIDGTDPIEVEVGDLATLLLAFCNIQNINLEKCVEATIKKRRNKNKK